MNIIEYLKKMDLNVDYFKKQNRNVYPGKLIIKTSQFRWDMSQISK